MNFRQSSDCTASRTVGPYFCRAISFCWYSSFRISTFCLRVWHSSSSPALAVCRELRSSSNFLIWSVRKTKISSVCVQRPQRQDWGGSSEKWEAWTLESIYLFSQILNCSNTWQFYLQNLPSRLHLVDTDVVSLSCKSFRSSSTTEIAVCVWKLQKKDLVLKVSHRKASRMLWGFKQVIPERRPSSA